MNRPADTAIHLLARVEVQADELIEFYEPVPGLIMISAAGRPETPAKPSLRVGEDVDVSGYWSDITGGAAMPLALQDAMMRARKPHAKQSLVKPMGPGAEEAARDNTRELSMQAKDGVAVTAQALASDWCDSTWYTYKPPPVYRQTKALGECPTDQDFVVCWDHVTGDGSAWHDDAYIMSSNVCPYRGQVIMTITNDESGFPQGSWTVPRNTYRQTWFTDGGCDWDPFNDCPHVKVAISNAANDGYNFRFWVTAE